MEILFLDFPIPGLALASVLGTVSGDGHKDKPRFASLSRRQERCQ